MNWDQWLISDSAPAWAQAILSAFAIVVSALIAVYVPHRERVERERRENRNRLNIITSRWENSGLHLEIQYRPEFSHVGIRAMIWVLRPLGTRYAYPEDIANPGMLVGARSGYQRTVPARLFNSTIAKVPLVRLDGEEALSGGVFLLPPPTGEPIKKAVILVGIQDDNDEYLLSTQLTVSPIDGGSWMTT